MKLLDDIKHWIWCERKFKLSVRGLPLWTVNGRKFYDLSDIKLSGRPLTLWTVNGDDVELLSDGCIVKTESVTADLQFTMTLDQQADWIDFIKGVQRHAARVSARVFCPCCDGAGREYYPDLSDADLLSGRCDNCCGRGTVARYPLAHLAVKEGIIGKPDLPDVTVPPHVPVELTS